MPSFLRSFVHSNNDGQSAGDGGAVDSVLFGSLARWFGLMHGAVKQQHVEWRCTGDHEFGRVGGSRSAVVVAGLTARTRLDSNFQVLPVR